jgi:hypothetical protein
VPVTDDKQGTIFSTGIFTTGIRLEIVQPRNGEIDTLKAIIWVADSLGEIWESSPFLRPDIFTGFLRKSTSVQFYTWQTAPEDWKTCFKSRCLVDDIIDLLDSRQRYDLKTSESIFVIIETYQGPAIDVALLDPSNLIVRIQNLYAEDYDQKGQFLDVEKCLQFVTVCRRTIFYFLMIPHTTT